MRQCQQGNGHSSMKGEGTVVRLTGRFVDNRKELGATKKSFFDFTCTFRTFCTRQS